MSDHCLNLKKCTLLCCYEASDQTKGINGARYVVEGPTGNVLHLKSVTGAFRGERLALPRVNCRPGDKVFLYLGLLEDSFQFERASP